MLAVSPLSAFSFALPLHSFEGSDITNTLEPVDMTMRALKYISRSHPSDEDGHETAGYIHTADVQTRSMDIVASTVITCRVVMSITPVRMRLSTRSSKTLSPI